jgi:hypothetical protein
VAIIDQSITWQKTEERLATETDPILRRNLVLLLEHQQAEAALDMERLMATISEEARYEQFGNEGSVTVGKAAVQKFYEDFAASGAFRLQFELDRFVVDRDCILTEGVMRMAWPGHALRYKGIPVDDLDAFYLYESRMAVIWPIGEDGLFIGEDSYVGADGFAGIADRVIDLSEIVMYEPAAA